MTRRFRHIAMILFIAAVIVLGFFGPYLLSILLLALAGLCWAFPQRREDEADHSSGASAIGS
ncbi:MAG: hypothetical protein JNK46_08755 [Methylobacteriaceae bacterium]|nr:hypothetical protein [Methylobacteriaceae bacterium]